MKDRHLQLILATCALVVYANAAPIGDIKGGSQSPGVAVVALPGVSPPGIGVLGAGISGGGNLGRVNPALSGGGSGLSAHSGSLGGPVIVGGMGGGSHGSLQIGPAPHLQTSGSTIGQSHGSLASAGSAPGGLSLNMEPHGSGLHTSASAGAASGGSLLILGQHGSGRHTSASAGAASGGSSLNVGLPGTGLHSSGTASAGAASGGSSLILGQHGSGLHTSASAATAHGGPSLDLGLQGSGIHSSASAAGAASESSLSLGLPSSGLGPSGLSAPHGVGSGLAGPTTSLAEGISSSGGNIVATGNAAHGGIQPVHVHTRHETRVTIAAVPPPAGPSGQPVPLLPGGPGAITSVKGGSIGVHTSKSQLPPPLVLPPAVPPAVIVPGSKQSPSLPDVKGV